MEFVFVVPRRDLFPDHYPYGFTPFGEGCSRERFHDVVRRCGFFVERARAETSPEWKQIIPYNIVLVGDEVLLLKRTARGGEARLHDKLTIGVGGHLNPVDLDGTNGQRDPLPNGSRRELDEELVIDGDYTVESIGLMNDDSNAVGAVHVGVVQLVRVHGQVGIREADVLEGRCVRPQELIERWAHGANFETWSAKLVENIAVWLPHLSSPSPSNSPTTPSAIAAPASGR